MGLPSGVGRWGLVVYCWQRPSDLLEQPAGGKLDRVLVRGVPAPLDG